LGKWWDRVDACEFKMFDLSIGVSTSSKETDKPIIAPSACQKQEVHLPGLFAPIANHVYWNFQPRVQNSKNVERLEWICREPTPQILREIQHVKM
jgi:hypothetical protein